MHFFEIVFGGLFAIFSTSMVFSFIKVWKNLLNWEESKVQKLYKHSRESLKITWISLLVFSLVKYLVCKSDIFLSFAVTDVVVFYVGILCLLKCLKSPMLHKHMSRSEILFGALGSALIVLAFIGSIALVLIRF